MTVGVNTLCFIELYTWNLYNSTNQCHPNKFNNKKENKHTREGGGKRREGRYRGSLKQFQVNFCICQEAEGPARGGGQMPGHMQTEVPGDQKRTQTGAELRAVPRACKDKPGWGRPCRERRGVPGSVAGRMIFKEGVPMMTHYSKGGMTHGDHSTYRCRSVGSGPW